MRNYKYFVNLLCNIHILSKTKVAQLSNQSDYSTSNFSLYITRGSVATRRPLFYLYHTSTTISVYFNSNYLLLRQHLRKDCQMSSTQSLSRQLSNACSNDLHIVFLICILPLTNMSFFKILYIFSTSSAVGESI